MAAYFNPPPNWPAPPEGWSPPPGWAPDPSWGPPPEGWQIWVESGADEPVGLASATPATQGTGTSWLARHKVLAGAGAAVAVVIIIGALSGGNDADEADRDASVAVAQEVEEVEEPSAQEAAAQKEADAEAERLAQEEAAAEAEAEAEAERVAEEQREAEEAAAAEAAAAEAARIGTVAQQNAYRTAANYLDYTAFSRSGLIGQLEYEEYSAADAEFAVARLEAEGAVDWNEQAAKSAANYLEYTAFSRAGLLDQLIYEGFTPEQAEHGVSTTGL